MRCSVRVSSLVCSLAVLALAAAADARPMMLADAVKAALDSFCEPVLAGGMTRAAALEAARVRGWTEAPSGLQVQEGHWGRVNAALSPDMKGCTITVPAGKAADGAAVEAVAFAEVWAERHGLTPDGPRTRVADDGMETVKRSWTARGGRAAMQASAYAKKPAWARFPDLVITVERRD